MTTKNNIGRAVSKYQLAGTLDQHFKSDSLTVLCIPSLQLKLYARLLFTDGRNFYPVCYNMGKKRALFGSIGSDSVRTLLDQTNSKIYLCDFLLSQKQFFLDQILTLDDFFYLLLSHGSLDIWLSLVHFHIFDCGLSKTKKVRSSHFLCQNETF